MSPDRIRPGQAARAASAPADGAEETTENSSTEEVLAPSEGEPSAEASVDVAVPEVDLVEDDAAQAAAAPAATMHAVRLAPPAPDPAPAAAQESDDEDEEVILVKRDVDASHGRFRRLYYGETSFDFVRRKRTWFTISAIVILAGVISLGVRGLNLSIDFVGGTSWTVVSPSLSVQSTEDALASAGFPGATVVFLGSGSSRTIQVEAKLPKGQSSATQTAQADKVAGILQHLAHQSSINDVSIESVGPSWGGQITHKAIIALIVFFILIALYISLFFEWRMAIAAIIAVLHDILVTVGIYSLTAFLVTPDTVVAFLTILGYSLYDTIVVFDRIRDNVKNLSVRDRLTFSDLVNLSMNQTLARSINTSLVAIMPILAVLILGAQILGATTLQYFGLALFVGLTTGAYSSIFIASPLVALMKEREPRYRMLRERLEQRGPSRWLLSPIDVARGFTGETAAARAAVGGGGAGRLRPGSASAPATTANGGGSENGTSRPSRPARPQQRRPAARSKRRGGRR